MLKAPCFEWQTWPVHLSEGQVHLPCLPNTTSPSQTYPPTLGHMQSSALDFTLRSIYILMVAARRTLAAGMALGCMGKPRFQLLRRTEHFLAFFPLMNFMVSFVTLFCHWCTFSVILFGLYLTNITEVFSFKKTGKEYIASFPCLVGEWHVEDENSN